MHQRQPLDPQAIGLSSFGKVIGVVRRSTAFVLLLAACACSGGGPTSPGGTLPSTVYVATTGNDRNDGTIAAPWQTLRHAVAQLHAGDTLYVRGGTYTGSANTIDSELGTVRGGTSWSNAITIAGYRSESVTIRPPQSYAGIGLTTSTAQYLIFQDLIIDMAEQGDPENAPNGVYLSGGANHNRFLRLEIKNNIDFGLVFSRSNGNSPFNEVLECRIHDNGLVGGPNYNGHGLYISTSDNLIEGNEVFDNQGYGLHLYDNAGPLNVARNVVRNNTFHNNGRHGGAYGIVVAWGDGNLVHDNRIYDNPGGLLVYTNSSNTRVYNNTIYNNRPLAGIRIEYATGARVSDNNVYGNGIDIEDLGTATTLSNNQGAQ